MLQSLHTDATVCMATTVRKLRCDAVYRNSSGIEVQGWQCGVRARVDVAALPVPESIGRHSRLPAFRSPFSASCDTANLTPSPTRVQAHGGLWLCCQRRPRTQCHHGTVQKRPTTCARRERTRQIPAWRVRAEVGKRWMRWRRCMKILQPAAGKGGMANEDR